ncbi:MAG: lipoprotein signal peptidase [Zoogloeaceae bacterium]|uniref:signal peptidase II n=1 Tax=Denitromonas sp. TaxID=2734609 RepID=UPI001E02A286|nr:lipoprotein signal peptidase [Rhodocyclaceae bacterium]MCP5221242.1 lipoprotein signal peptidase [Zoogloeaceae bacterium]HQU89430.1 signal peptidase II [Denitromonas sp.]
MRPRFSLWLGFAAVVVVLDQLTKQIVLAQLVPGESIPVTRFFNLVLLFNPGAAFSFLADHSGWQRWFFTGLAAAICLWLGRLMYQHQHERLQPFAFALIIGGAIGNVIDRLAIGAVVDFLYFHVGRYGWPAFNLADSAITLGVGLMLWAQFRPAANASPKENHS